MKPSGALWAGLVVGLIGIYCSSASYLQPNTRESDDLNVSAMSVLSKIKDELPIAELALDLYVQQESGVTRDQMLGLYEKFQDYRRTAHEKMWRPNYIFTDQVMGFCTLFFAVSESITVQLETLEVSLSRIKFRAAHMVKLEPKEQGIENVEEFRKALHVCFKHSIKHHQTIIRVFENFRDICYISLLWLIVGLTFLLCLSAVLFTSDASVISKGVFASFLLTELLITFIQCWYGEWFAGTSSDLPWDLYDSDWYTISREMLIYHKMLTIRCTRPLQLSAGGFTKISRTTFLEVIKTAFSYTNLLQASNKRRVTTDDY